MNAQQAVSEVNSLGERYGWQLVAGEALKRWMRKEPDTAFRMGPPAAFTTDCRHWGHSHPTECGWCAGSGWVTHKVAKLASELPHV